MSTWYQYHIEVIAKNKEAVAKFFNLDPKDDVRVDHFEFSFGQKNGPGLRLGKIIEQNPDLIFLVKQSVEVDSVSLWVERADAINKKSQRILIEDSGEYVVEINKKLLDMYAAKFPSLPAKHLAREKGFEEFRWSYLFYDFEKTAEMLAHANEYEEMVSPMDEDDRLELDES